MNRSKPSNLAARSATAPSPLRMVARAIADLGRAPGRHWDVSLIGSLTVLLTASAWAAPTSGVVSAGQARIVQSGTLTNVTQQSSRAVIDWQGFSVAANESVNFQQPSTSAVTLNRVDGSDPSSVLGHITANGSVFLVNPNGIVFGQGSTVDVSGLVAATANISNANFMAGNYRFDQAGSAAAKVQNQGTIRIANAGIAALVGRQVSNSGFISANLGKVSLVGGDVFVLDLGADHLVSLILDPAAIEQIVDAQGVPLMARVDNTGAIAAGGGRVEISADTVSHLLDNVINVQGDIRATSVQSHDGTISLTGGATTDATLGGVLQAGGAGGLVTVAGRDVTVAAGAQIDMGSGAALQLNATHDLHIDAPLNGLYDGAVGGGALTATAGHNLAISQSIATNNGALSLSAGGTLTAATGTTLQSGSQALSLSGAAGVVVDRVLSQGAVAITSSAGAVDVASAIAAPSTGTDAEPAASVTVQAQQGLTLHGALASGNITLNAAGDVALLDAPVESTGGNIVAQAGGALNLSAAAITPADIRLGSGGALNVAQVLGGSAGGTSNSIMIDGGGAVTLAGANAGAGGIAVTGRGGDVTSPGATGGLVSSGSVTVDALAGQAGTAAAPLTISAGDGAGAAGGASVFGHDGVTVGALVTPGAVLLRSDNGNVVATSAIAGSVAASLADAAPVVQLQIQAAGDVTLAGARTGASGFSVTGTAAGGGAGSFSLSGGALLSDGDVAVTTTGAIRLDALVQSGGNVTMTSTAGTLTVGSAGMSVTSAGHGISLTAGTDLQLNGDLAIQSGTIALASTGGTVTALVTTPGANPVDADATIDAGSDPGSQVTVSAAGNVALGDIRAGGGATISSTTSNVQMLSPIGGQNTGYLFYANGYQSSLRPTLGTLAITAGGSVELNGLNLDGLADPHATGTGLSVVAGHMILSNETIAVNKGDILLQALGTSGTDGVYLGSSVFSRGWDSVGSDGQRGGTGTAADEKVGYGIQVKGHNLGLFDNNIDVATLPGLYVVTLADGTPVYTDSHGNIVDKNGRPVSPAQRVTTPDDGTTLQIVDAATATDDVSVVGVPISRTVDKIEISNNVANYQDDPSTAAGLAARQTLVPVSNVSTIPQINVNVDLVGGVGNSVVTGDGGVAGRQPLTGFVPALQALSQAPIVVTPSTSGGPTVASSRGIALKLLGFEGASDSATQIWSDGIAFGEVTTAQESTLDPNTAYGASPVFSVASASGTSALFSAAGPLPAIAAPVGGKFTFTVSEVPASPGAPPAFVIDSGAACVCNSATYHLELLSGVSPVNGLPLNGFARVDSIDVVVDAQGHTSPGHPADPSDGASFPSSATDVNRVLQIRFAGDPTIASNGSSSGAQLRGNLITASGAPDSASVTAGPVLTVVKTPGFQQQPDGTIVQSLQLDSSGSPAPGYALGRVIIDSSTADTYPASQGGTRVLIFDGVLATGVAHGQGDSTGAANFVPGFGGISGNNNSTTGFTSVNATLGSASGTSQGAAVGSTSGSISASAGVAPGTGFIAAPVVPSDAGGTVPVAVDTSHVENSAQDVAQSTPATTPAAATTDAAQPIEIGVSPASQADLGRSGGVAGAATNVFRRGYRLASSTDDQVCAPGVIEPAAAAGANPGGARPCGAGGTAPAAQGAQSH